VNEKRSPAFGDLSQRRTLAIVLALNLALTAGFAVTGMIGDSSALLANALDSASDSLVFAISLAALTRSGAWKRGAARVSGVTLLVFAAGVLVDTARRYFEGSEPLGPTIMMMGAVGAALNALCLWLLVRLRHKDVNLRAATTFSWNDFASNGGIFIAGGLVIWTGSNWPDLLVGAAVAAIAVNGGIDILRDAHGEADKAKRS
jgi:Co/Zn/Cd efflux system component